MQPLFLIHRNARAKGTLHQKRSIKAQATFGDKAVQVLAPNNGHEKSPIDDQGVAQFLAEIDEKRMDIILATVGNLRVNPNSYGRSFSCNESESVDVRFDPDVRDEKEEPYMGFGRSAEEAKKDILRLLLKSGKIIIEQENPLVADLSGKKFYRSGGGPHVISNTWEPRTLRTCDIIETGWEQHTPSEAHPDHITGE